MISAARRHAHAHLSAAVLSPAPPAGGANPGADGLRHGREASPSQPEL
jgi:hypothetical protein